MAMNREIRIANIEVPNLMAELQPFSLQMSHGAPSAPRAEHVATSVASHRVHPRRVPSVTIIEDKKLL